MGVEKNKARQSRESELLSNARDVDAPASPPVIAIRMLSRLLPVNAREAMLGDLEEHYRNAILPQRGARRANRWFWREAIAALFMPRPRSLPTQQNAKGDSTMTSVQSDFRFAWRMMVRRPAFTLLTVGILALGIGATTAIFSAVNPILFDSLPYPNADQLMIFWENGDLKSNVGYATFADINEQNRSFSAMAAMSYSSATMTGKGEPQFLVGQRVSPSFFGVLGVAPALGRDFRNADNVRGTQRVVILSNALWRNRFGGDSSLIGKPITLDGNSFIVLGVMPAAFENVLSPTAQFWTPLRYDVSLPQACRSCRHLRAIARRRADVSLVHAQKDVNGIWQRMSRDFPKVYGKAALRVPRLGDDVVSGVRPALLAVLGAVAVVLLIACLNVMNLLLAKGAQREGEFAVRAALGAGRTRIVRQLLAESVLLAVLGGAAGVGIAVIGVRVLVALSPSNLPRLSAIHVNGSVLAFAVGITTLVAIAFGLVPGMYATRKNLQGGIRRGARRAIGASRLTRSALVVSEVALAIVLLVGSGLLFRSMEHLFAIHPGFDATELLTMQIQSGAGKLRNDTLVSRFFTDALRAVRAQPGVVAAALTSQLPLSDDQDQYGVHFENKPPLEGGVDNGHFRYGISDGYFEAMKIPLRQGRLFTLQDGSMAPLVVIINQSFATKRFGSASPLGQRVKVGGEDGPWREIVGVVGDVKQASLASDELNAIYVPEAQWQFVDYAMTLVVRAQSNAARLTPSLRNAIWSVDKDQPIVRIATAEQVMADRAAERRFALVLFESFAALALVLAAAGIYGVLSGTVSERVRELGVRAALGATGRDQIAMVMQQGLSLTGAGVVIGMVIALASSRAISGLLFNVSPVDPATYAAVAVGLVAVALVACWVPARRASKASPMEALRTE